MQALDADLVHHALPVGGADLDADGDITNPTIVAELRSVVATLARRSRATTTL